jgi:hypothetical protein
MSVVSKTFCLLVLGLVFAGFSAGALCTLYPDTVLRRGPGTKYPISWRVGKYMPLVDTEYKSGWYKVKDLDGDIHWVYRKAVSTSMQCMAVRTSQATLRTGPGTDKTYGDLPTVGKYYAFKRIGFEPPWYWVEDEARGRYWIHENLLWLPLKRQQYNF